MTSYSSSVSRIGALSATLHGQNRSTLGALQIRRHHGDLGIAVSSFISGIYRLCAIRREKSIRESNIDKHAVFLYYNLVLPVWRNRQTLRT